MSATRAHCYHCAMPCLAAARWTVTVDGAPREFCCAGCLAVAQTLHAAGLGALYSARTQAPRRAPSGDDRHTAHWGDAAEAGGLVRTLPDGRREASLLIEGMTCGACVPLVEAWLARQPGVSDAHVNYANRRALVTWQPNVTRLSALLRALTAAGYAAFPYDPARREMLATIERRALLSRMAVALLAMMQVMMFALPLYLADDGVAPEHRRLLDWASFVLALPVLCYSATPFLSGAWRDVTHRRLGMDVPIVIGIAAAFAASAWSVLQGTGPVYFDSITMFVALLLVARYVDLVARQRAGAAIETIARQRPDMAERLPGWPLSAPSQSVAASTLNAGDLVLIRPGANVPADGEIVDGRSHVEEAMLTGESVARLRVPGQRLWAGAMNCDNALVMRVSAAGDDTRLAAILRLAERAAAQRPAVARAADRIASWFVAGLLLIATATVVFWVNHEPSRALVIAFAVLAVSCPCALALATPAALAAAAGSLARRGVVLARSDALETLAKVTHVVFDKTGTLTEGGVHLVGCVTASGRTRDDALQVAAALEARSEHPLARALVAAAPRGEVDFDDAPVQAAGEGVSARIKGREMRVGRPDFVAQLSGALPASMTAFARERPDTLVGLGDEGGWIAMFAFADALRPGTARLVSDLHAMGIATVLLSGDGQRNVDLVAAALGIGDARGGMRPEDKRDAIAQMQRAGAVVAMTGDGINDAPALAQAQVSLSLGSATPLAQWTSDVVIVSDEVGLIAEIVGEARRTFRVIRQNLAWAIAYNAIAVPAAAFGWVTPLLAAIGMSGSSLLVVGNALRLTRPVRAQSSPAVARTPAEDALESAWKS